MQTIPNGYDLSRCMQAVAAIDAEMIRLTANLTECQFHAPPRAGGWSVGQCIEHLILTGNAFLLEWDAASQAGISAGLLSEGPFPYSWLERSILRFAEPPYRLRTKTMRQFAPCSRRSLDETVRRFHRMHQQLAARISASKGLDAAEIKVKSPFVSWIRYPLGLSFDLALAHERRHLWQARQVREQLSGTCPDETPCSEQAALRRLV
jgi:DinB family protein